MAERNSLFEHTDGCCGCGACAAACPRSAIIMREGPGGFRYPVVEDSLCVDCGICAQVCCVTADVPRNAPQQVLAASFRDTGVCERSSSGGVFAALACAYLEKGGVVFGTAMDETFSAKVIAITRKEDLPLLQGSKYVQSRMDECYHSLKEQVLTGRPVLFCGTSCQIAAVRAYLKGDYANLLLAEILCHGVPSNQMFRDYIGHLQETKKILVKEFRFRDKNVRRSGDGTARYTQNNDGTLIYCAGKHAGREKFRIKRFDPCLSSYYYLFLKDHILRPSCYRCSFADQARVGDLTICDYWGVEQQEPQFAEAVRRENLCGISAILVNTQKGAEAIRQIEDAMLTTRTEFQKVAARNPQLCHPRRMPAEREQVMRLYGEQGYAAVEADYRKKNARLILSKRVTGLIPREWKDIILKLRRL